jgi:hypothetical protein
MQGDVMLIAEMAEELPFGPGQRVRNGWTSTCADSGIEQLIKS